MFLQLLDGSHPQLAGCLSATIQSAANFLVTDVVIMGILTIAAVALALELLLRLAERLLVPWKRHG